MARIVAVLASVMASIAMAAIPGDIIINEIMVNPVAPIKDFRGEWFELYNPTSDPIDLNGWNLSDNRNVRGNDMQITESVIVPAKGYAVLGRNNRQNGNVHLDYRYSGKSFQLADKRDAIILHDENGVEIDRVVYGRNGITVTPGKSLSLKDTSLRNNIASSWCAASTLYTTNNYGTPGRANDCNDTPTLGDDPREPVGPIITTPEEPVISTPEEPVTDPNEPVSDPNQPPTDNNNPDVVVDGPEDTDLEPNGDVVEDNSPPNPDPLRDGRDDVPPVIVPTDPVGGGDPHFRTWLGEKFAFHGACDLVLLSNPDFDNGIGLDIHIRTKIRRTFSFIGSVAVRIGDDILEIVADHKRTHYFNGIEHADFPLQLDEKYDATLKNIDEYHRNFVITLDPVSQESIIVKVYKDLVTVSVHNGSPQHFENSLGLMGDYHKGHLTGRDHTTIFTQANAFGAEWQVRGDVDQILFQKIQMPVYPQTCQMPDDYAIKKRRRLDENNSGISKDAARKVCAQVNGQDFDFCVFDVMATGDVGLVSMYQQIDDENAGISLLRRSSSLNLL